MKCKGLKYYLDTLYVLDNKKVFKLLLGIKYYSKILFEAYNIKHGSRVKFHLKQ